MRASSEYEHDVFLSWKGINRPIKNKLYTYLHDVLGLRVYDSDKHCKGDFSKDFAEALTKSMVYVLILTDDLRDTGNTEYVTEVTNECNLALSLERSRELNIVPLSTSTYFFESNPALWDFNNDELGTYFRQAVNRRSIINSTRFTEDGDLLPQVYSKLKDDVLDYIKARKAGNPHMPVNVECCDVEGRDLPQARDFTGRAKELEAIYKGFKSNAKVVVLSGIGGMGKTTLAEQFARNVKGDNESPFRFLQTVYVQEGQGNGGMKVLASATEFTESFRDKIAACSQDEQLECKIQALKRIPENFLLVVDNFNNLTEGALDELLKLKCRLLITTRINIESIKRVEDIKDGDDLDGGVCRVEIDRLAEEDARKLFMEKSEKQITAEQFRDIFAALGGHTITLCIAAKLLKEQLTLTVEKLMEKLGSLENLDEKTEFVHNKTDVEDTLFNHLKVLFNVSAPDEGCLHILRNMCLLSDGAIPEEDLIKALNLSNCNEINTLVKKGWLERSETAGVRSLYLHPILSQLLMNLDGVEKPDSANCEAIIGYILSAYERTKSEMNFSDAHLMQVKLYFALYRLARGEGKLHPALWDAFVQISSLLGDSEDLKKMTDRLQEGLTLPAEKSKVASYYDSVYFEQHTGDLKLLEGYVDRLNANSADYKWVLQALSLSALQLIDISEYKPALSKLIIKAMQAAAEKGDDIAMMNLIQFGVIVEPKKTLPLVDKYIKSYKAKKKEEGSFLYLQYFVDSIKVICKKQNFIEGYADMLKQLADIADISDISVKEIIKRIIKTIKKYGLLSIIKFAKQKKRIDKMFKKVPDDDVFKIIYNLQIKYANKLYDGGEKAAEYLFEALVYLYKYNYEHGMTLVKIDEAIKNAINIIKTMPGSERSMFLNQYVGNVPIGTGYDVTLEEYTNLSIGCRVYEELKDEKALEQSRRLLDIEKMRHTPGNYRVIGEMLRHGNCCVTFGRKEEALSYFKEAYELLVQSGERTRLLHDVCIAILSLPVDVIVDISWLEDVKNKAVLSSATDKEAFMVMTRFCKNLQDRFPGYLASATKQLQGVPDEDIQNWISNKVGDCVRYVFRNLVQSGWRHISVVDFKRVLKDFIPKHLKLNIEEKALKEFSLEEMADAMAELCISEIEREMNYFSGRTTEEVFYKVIKKFIGSSMQSYSSPEIYNVGGALIFSLVVTTIPELISRIGEVTEVAAVEVMLDSDTMRALQQKGHSRAPKPCPKTDIVIYNFYSFGKVYQRTLEEIAAALPAIKDFKESEREDALRSAGNVYFVHIGYGYEAKKQNCEPCFGHELNKAFMAFFAEYKSKNSKSVASAVYERLLASEIYYSNEGFTAEVFEHYRNSLRYEFTNQTLYRCSSTAFLVLDGLLNKIKKQGTVLDLDEYLDSIFGNKGEWRVYAEQLLRRWRYSLRNLSKEILEEACTELMKRLKEKVNEGEAGFMYSDRDLIKYFCKGKERAEKYLHLILRTIIENQDIPYVPKN